MSEGATNCAICSQELTGTWVKVGERGFHKECFVCPDCGKYVASEFFERDGKFFCKTDFFAKHGERCRKCDKPVLDRVLVALGHKFHPECLTCIVCNANLSDGASFAEKDGDPVCMDCADEDEEAPAVQVPCSRCNLPFGPGEEILTALVPVQSYHPGCFTCKICNIPVPDGFKGHEGELYCISDYLDRFGDRCISCKKVITDRVLTSLGASWHVSCFYCRRCGTAYPESPDEVAEELRAEGPAAAFVMMDGQPYCSEICAIGKKGEKVGTIEPAQPVVKKVRWIDEEGRASEVVAVRRQHEDQTALLRALATKLQFMQSKLDRIRAEEEGDDSDSDSEASEASGNEGEEVVEEVVEVVDGDASPKSAAPALPAAAAASPAAPAAAPGAGGAATAALKPPASPKSAKPSSPGGGSPSGRKRMPSPPPRRPAADDDEDDDSDAGSAGSGGTELNASTAAALNHSAAGHAAAAAANERRRESQEEDSEDEVEEAAAEQVEEAQEGEEGEEGEDDDDDAPPPKRTVPTLEQLVETPTDFTNDAEEVQVLRKHMEFRGQFIAALRARVEQLRSQLQSYGHSDTGSARGEGGVMRRRPTDQSLASESSDGEFSHIVGQLAAE